MAKQKIFKFCDDCKGTGQIMTNNSTAITCPRCEGQKKIEWGYLKVEQEVE